VIAPRLSGAPTDMFARQGWMWTYLNNFDIARRGWYTGVGSHANNLWSLAIEEQFYLVFPLVVYLLSRRGVMIFAVGCLLVAIASRFALDHAGLPPRTAYVLTFARLDGLAFGVMLAVIARTAGGLDRIVPLARVAVGLALVGLAALVAHTGRYGEDWSTLQGGIATVCLGFAGLLTLAVAPHGSPRVRRFFEARSLRFLGRYSYGLYMWHALIGGLMSRAGLRQRIVADAVGSGDLGVLLTIVLKIAVSIVAALASFYLLERPFLRLKDRAAPSGATIPRPAAMPG
jgi:peptidoglycan/LPS O-acetylase OafA/YrhL